MLVKVPAPIGLLLSLALVACGGSGLSGNVFRQGDVAFQVGTIPSSWRLLDQEIQGDLPSFAFRDSNRSVTVGAAGRCRLDGDDVPLRSLTQHLYLGFTHREIQHEEEFQLADRAALRTEMTARLDGVSKQLIFVVLKKDGCVYDFWRIADQPVDSADFDEFVRGFRVLR